MTTFEDRLFNLLMKPLSRIVDWEDGGRKWLPYGLIDTDYIPSYTDGGLRYFDDNGPITKEQFDKLLNWKSRGVSHDCGYED